MPGPLKGHLGVILGLGLLVGCAVPATTQRQSDLLAYLSRKDEQAPARPEVVRVRYPMKVGVAFVPGGSARVGDVFRDQSQKGAAISLDQESQLTAILQRHLLDRPWVRELKVIPSSYLQAGGGFTDPKWFSWTYWTVVGAYTIKGDKNDTSTFVDGAVFHVSDRILLFRADGSSLVKGSTTWANRDEGLRRNAREGLSLAVQNLGRRLEEAEATFRAEVAEGRRKDVEFFDGK
ncbi:MAG: hypothetical protein H6Q00_679 [Holophagaceae bacterium]|nr:hypothetical protein [Holophagaceae bacterium]